MSYRQARGKPVREVELQITVEAENEILERISRLSRGASLSGGSLSITIRGRSPVLVARKARKFAEIVRSAAAESK